jgi:hypothetical protein
VSWFFGKAVPETEPAFGLERKPLTIIAEGTIPPLSGNLLFETTLYHEIKSPGAPEN